MEDGDDLEVARRTTAERVSEVAVEALIVSDLDEVAWRLTGMVVDLAASDSNAAVSDDSLEADVDEVVCARRMLAMRVSEVGGGYGGLVGCRRCQSMIVRVA